MTSGPDPEVALALQWWTEYWRGVYAMPRAWAHKAERLIHAFEAVADASVAGSHHLDMRDQALMLVGMAIELLLKSLIVNSPAARDVVTKPTEALTIDEKQLRRLFYRHDLVTLAQQANVTLSEQEAETAAVLSQYITWRGRYVIPTRTSIDELLPIKHRDGLVGAANRDITIDSARALLGRVIASVKTGLYGEAPGV